MDLIVLFAGLYYVAKCLDNTDSCLKSHVICLGERSILIIFIDECIGETFLANPELRPSFILIIQRSLGRDFNMQCSNSGGSCE